MLDMGHRGRGGDMSNPAAPYFTYYIILLAFGLIAQHRGRNGLYWSALALFITPIFAGLLLWLMTRKLEATALPQAERYRAASTRPIP